MMYGYQIYIKCDCCDFVSFFYIDKTGKNLEKKFLVIKKNLIKYEEVYEKLPKQLKIYVDLFSRKPPYDKIIIVNKKWKITIGGEEVTIPMEKCPHCNKTKHQYAIKSMDMD